MRQARSGDEYGQNRTLFHKQLTALCALLLLPTAAGAQQLVLDNSNRPDYVYVISAEEGAFSGRTLTMKRVAPAVVVFSDRPTRIAGHMSTNEFVRRFSRWADQIDADPPNAVLSVLGLERSTVDGARTAQPQAGRRDPALGNAECCRAPCPRRSGSAPCSWKTQRAHPCCSLRAQP